MINLSAAIAASALLKPPEGALCNGCGYCCLAEQCGLSIRLFGKADICPALERAGDRWACGLITTDSAELSLLAGKMLGIGTGCDAKAEWED